MASTLKAQNIQIDTTEVVISIQDGMLYGTLSFPTQIKNRPLAIIIPGSGPTDRNGNTPMLNNNCLHLLSNELLNHGIATLKFDKRGVGQSQIFGFKEENLTFEDYVDDVRKWVKHFSADTSFSNIYLIGHSEGSLIGIIAAQKSNIKAFISMAGTAYPADEIIKKQLKANNIPEALYQESIGIIDSLKNDIIVKNTPPDLAILFRESVQPYLISWFKYKPTEEIRKLNIPILAIHGTNDLQLAHHNAYTLKEANQQIKVIIIDDMNHILKDAGDDLLKNQQSYNDPTLPIHEELSKEIIKFINTYK